MNIALIASQGGHLGQIKLLFTEEVIGLHKVVLITEKENYSEGYQDGAFLQKFRAYYFKKDYLLSFNPFRYFSWVLKLWNILKNEKIDLIVTTGAQISIPALFAARLLSIKTIFIDTVIRVKTPNWSAKLCYYLANFFYVQHRSMISKYGQKSIYAGGIL